MSLEGEKQQVQLQNQLEEDITQCEEKGESKETQMNQSYFNLKDRGTLKRGSTNLQKSFVEILKQNDTIPEFLLTLDRVCSKSLSKDNKNDEQQQEQNSTMTVGLKAPSSIGKEVNFIDKQQILELLKESDQEGRRRSYTAEEKSKPRERLLSQIGQEVDNLSPPEHYMKISQIIRKLLYESCPEYRIIGFLNYYIQYISPINFFSKVIKYSHKPEILCEQLFKLLKNWMVYYWDQDFTQYPKLQELIKTSIEQESLQSNMNIQQVFTKLLRIMTDWRFKEFYALKAILRSSYNRFFLKVSHKISFHFHQRKFQDSLQQSISRYFKEQCPMNYFKIIGLRNIRTSILLTQVSLLKGLTLFLLYYLKKFCPIINSKVGSKLFRLSFKQPGNQDQLEILILVCQFQVVWQVMRQIDWRRVEAKCQKNL